MAYNCGEIRFLIRVTCLVCQAIAVGFWQVLARHISFLLSFIFITFLFSCSQERQLARKFVASSDTICILLLKTDYIFKKNLKINTDSSLKLRDSTNIVQKELLHNVNEKMLVDILFSGVFDKLKKQKIKVFSEENTDVFLLSNSAAYIFNLAQIELDEYSIPYTASQRYDTLIYSEDFNLNAAKINLWYEVSELNNTQENWKVLFADDYISDCIDGHFRKIFLSNDIRFIYSRINITQDDIYLMAAKFADTNAAYIYDYFLNDYIHRKYNGRKKLKYFHFDLQKRKLYPAGNNRFIFM